MKRSSLKRKDPLKVNAGRLGGQAHGHPPIEKRCEVCGDPYMTPWSGRQRRKTCSRRCAAIAKQASNKTRTGTANPAYKHGERAGARDRGGERRFRDTQIRCRAPGCAAHGDHQHHVVYRQHVRVEHGDEWDPDNALALCVSCHASHHRRGRTLPLACLRDENIAFAARWLGPGPAHVYLHRYYAGTDPRVDALLEQL